MERIVFLDRASVRAALRTPALAHSWVDHASTEPTQTEARLRGTTIAVVNKVRLPGELLARLPDLRLVACAATGTDNIDLAWCRDHGLAVTNIQGYAERRPRACRHRRRSSPLPPKSPGPGNQRFEPRA